METFVLKALQYGVLGLCAVMLVVAWRIIRVEQRRQDEPRMGILRFTYAFMVFCFALGGLTSYVQLHEHYSTIEAEQRLSRIRAAAGPLLNARKPVVESLPDTLPQKRILVAFTNELRAVLSEN